MTNIQQAMIDLQQQIMDNDYYVELYDLSLIGNQMHFDGITEEEYSDDQIINLCNDFWLALPDSPSIRRQPFFALCDIAEHCFDDESE